MRALRSPSQRAALLCVAVAAAHAGTIALARAISRTTTEGVPLWAAAGVTVSALLLAPRRWWPAVLATTFATNLAGNLVLGIALDTAAGGALANTVEPWVGALFVWHVIGGPPVLSVPRHLFVFLTGAVVVAPLLGAVVGAASIQLAPGHPPYVDVLERWWAGDALGVLVIGSLVLAWAQASDLQRDSEHSRAEAAALAIAVVGLSVLAFWGSSEVLAYVVIPPLVWAALRFGVRGATLGGLAIAVIADWATIRDHGLFVALGGEGTHQALWHLQLFLAVLLISALVLAVAVCELGVAQRAEAALRAARDAAEAAATAKTEFLATMSHEIRTPMSAVTSLIELLCETELDPEQQSLLHTMQSSSASLLRIIDDTLDYSKIEAGMLDIESLPMSIDAEVNAISSLMRPAAIAKGITLTCTTEPEQPAVVLGDPVRIRQILLNLVNNAIKFTSVGGVELSAAVPAADGSPSPVDVTFTVRDSGIGIDPERQADLFEPFTQAEHSTTRLYGGTGLGLSIVSGIIELMHGAVTVSSTPGDGATFVVSLPLPLAPEGAAPAMAPSRPRPPDRYQARIAGHIVLIAEDNEVNREVLSRQLAQLGSACDVVPNGQAALDRLALGGISLLLTDCHMPLVDGFALTRAIREAEEATPDEPRLPIVAITANAIQGEGERCLAAGMDAYLTKPVELARLAAVLTSLVPDTPVRGAEPIDLDVLREIVGGDEAVVAEILETCATLIQSQADEVQAGLDGGDRTRVAAAAHRIVGAGASVGARRLVSLARAVEIGAATAHDVSARAATDAMLTEVRVVIDALSPLEAGHA